MIQETTTFKPVSDHPDRTCLRDFALGRLSIDELERCAAHLQTCEACCQFIQTIPADPLMALVRHAAPARDQFDPRQILQKYELLEEIGRGGMSVVYKARQVGLERIVALKQIKTDAITPEGVARFRAEAGAMARVRHPNIVQVHDFGDQDGRPYLACEFIAGGSLDRYLNGVPLSPRAACRLVATIARAVQVAHDHAIIHRDLKPSNVLLSYPDDRDADHRSDQFWERVVPKIGDFGLAKLLDQVHGQTQTGDVMGTPGYMAPEQASGQVQQVGAATDIFSLGVILYELLTGRQPFRAASIIQTLELIRTADPVSPRHLQPTLPRDLDVICLKCLEKDPGRRYASAADLADDLDRWLDQEPILARPVSSWERGWKWVRRHQAVSGMLTVAAMAVIMLLTGLFWHNHTLQAEVKRASANESAALSAYQQGYDVIQGMVEELLGQHVDTEVDDRQIHRLFEIVYAYHSATLEGVDLANPEVRFAKASSRFYMGAIHEQTGEWEKALPLLQSAREELESLIDDVHDATRLNGRLAACYTCLARTRQGASRTLDSTTIGEMQKACQIYDMLVQSQPQNVRFRRRLAHTLHDLAVMYLVSGQNLKAEHTSIQAIEAQQTLERMTTLRINDRVGFERTISFLGRLRTSQGRFDEADEIFKNGEAMLVKSSDQSGLSDVQSALADIFDARCFLEQSRGRILPALQCRTRSIELLHSILAEIPKHRFAKKFLAEYQASERELLLRLMNGDSTGAEHSSDVRDDVTTIASHIQEIRSLRIQEQFEQAEADLQKLETRLQTLQSQSNSPALTKLSADMNFEWAELHIARDQLDAALGRYDRAIAYLNEIVEQIHNRSAVVDLLSNCHRLKAWHLSRAGLVDSAFAEWDLAIKTAVGPVRDFLRAERALERAGLNDHAGAVSEANQVTTVTNLNTTTLMHLARVYSVSLRAVRTDEKLDSKSRQIVGDSYADRAVSCLKRAAQAPSPIESLLQNLDDDSVFAELRETEIYKSWRDATELNKTP